MSNESVDFRIAKVLNSLPEEVEKDTIYLIRKDDGFDICVSNGIGDLEVYDLNADVIAKEVGRRVEELDEHFHNDMDTFNSIIQGLSPVNLRVKSDVVTKVAKSDGEVQLTWEVVKQSNDTSIAEAFNDRVEFGVDGVFTFKTDIIIGRSGGTEPMDLSIIIKENDVVLETQVFPDVVPSENDKHVTFETVVDGAQGKVITVFVSSDGSESGTLDIKELKCYMLSQSIGSALQIPEASTTIAGLTKYGTTEGTAAQGNDERITGAAQKSANLSDLADAEDARQNLGLGTAATKNVGTGDGNVMEVGTGGWFGRASPDSYISGYPQDTSQNVSQIYRRDSVDEGVSAFASSIHFTANDTWGRLRVGHNNQRAWIQGGTDQTGMGWTAELYHTGNITAMSSAEGDAGTATTPRIMRADNLRQIISKIPSVNKTTAYTAVATDRGKGIDTTSDVTIPADVFSLGDVLVVTNTSSSDINIIPESGVTMRKAGTAVTGTITLSGYGMATMRMATLNTWFISGAGIA